MNIVMLWFFLLPIAAGAVVWFIHRNDEGSWIPAIALATIGIIVIAVSFFAARSAATSDTEIWNGEITAKARVHGTYVESYECNCRTVTSGSGKNQTSSTKCDTCYRDHYTVNWGCDSTVGPFTIDHADWTNRGVYALPNPQRWVDVVIGEPAAVQHSYTNYVQAVPDSLFKPSSASLKAQFAALTPKYPDSVYDFYRNDHFLSPGYNVADARQWNIDIANALRKLGPAKQVNAIVVVAKTSDPNYEFALRDSWEGANKNDVVLLIGSSEYPKIDFVRVISWTKNEAFRVELRDNLIDLGVVDRSKIVPMLSAQIAKNFERRHMAEFKYLEAEIDPPTWLLCLDAILIFGGMAGLLVFGMPRFNSGFSNRSRSLYR